MTDTQNISDESLSKMFAESMKPYIQEAVKEAMKEAAEAQKTPAQRRADILAIKDRHARQEAIKDNIELFRGGA